MPQKRNNPKPPPAMTWGRAALVLATAIVLDLMRIFFEFFWFFGPATGAAYCTVKTGSSAVTDTLCGAVAGVAGFAASPVTTWFGVVMAMAVGFASFLILGFWILLTNRRLFTANALGMLQFVSGFGVAEIPFLGTIPSFSIILFRLYARQISTEKKELKKWESENAARLQQEREQQMIQIAQIKQLQEAQIEHVQQAQEAENDDLYRLQA